MSPANSAPDQSPRRIALEELVQTLGTENFDAAREAIGEAVLLVAYHESEAACAVLARLLRDMVHVDSDDR